MVARQLENRREKVMDGTLYVVFMAKFLRNYKLLFNIFIKINNDIIYVDSKRNR